ncbi:MAG: hypothetical protein O2805_05910 [Proteobacteria bacterium]|nr:hypothetical protein [Pseudomonadota bacterium]
MTDTATSCKFSARFEAVTVISSSSALATDDRAALIKSADVAACTAVDTAERLKVGLFSVAIWMRLDTYYSDNGFTEDDKTSINDF